MEDHVRHSLKRGFDYATGAGETQTASFIEMNEPTAGNVAEMAQLRQCFIQAIREQNFEPDPDAPPPKEGAAEEDIDPIEVINLMASSSVDLAKMFSAAKKLLLSRGVCFIDGDTKMTATLWDKLSARDVELMVGAYIARFIMPS